MYSATRVCQSACKLACQMMRGICSIAPYMHRQNAIRFDPRSISVPWVDERQSAEGEPLASLGVKA